MWYKPQSVTIGGVLLLVILFAAGSFAVASPGFVENRGQVDDPVRYYAFGSPVSIYFTPEAVVLDLKEQIQDPEPSIQLDHRTDQSSRVERSGDAVRRGCAVWIRFEDANRSPAIEARGELVTRYHYFLGNDPDRWQTDVPLYAEVVYRDLWPGIDLVYRIDRGTLTYELVVNSDADPTQLDCTYEGAERVTATGNGAFLVETPVGEIRDTRPASGTGVGRLDWGGPETGASGAFGHADAGYRGTSNLEWSTFLGGVYSDRGSDIAIDSQGRVVVTGSTESFNFPTTVGSYDELPNGLYDVFAAMLDPDVSGANQLIWSTFLGGSGNDKGHALALNTLGRVALTGRTESDDFPTPGSPYDDTLDGESDAFVAKLLEDGSDLRWSGYLGGDLWDWGQSVAIRPSGRVVVTGTTFSSNFPTEGTPYDDSPNGGPDVFVSKFDRDGDILHYSTYLGGSEEDYGTALAINSAGDILVTGTTASPNFPMAGTPYDHTHNGEGDVFLAQFDPYLTTLIRSTFLGAEGQDYAEALAIDRSGRPVVAGWTRSHGFPTTPGAYDRSFNGIYDVYVTKLDPEFATLFGSTYLGGRRSDVCKALAVGPCGSMVVAGFTMSPDFPVTPSAYDRTYDAEQDVFVAALSGSGRLLRESTFLGDEENDEASGVALDMRGGVFVVGGTESSNFPTTTDAYDRTHNGLSDAFVAELMFLHSHSDVAYVSAGTFMMGDGVAYCGVDEHEVTLTHDFFLALHEVTNMDYLVALQWAYDNGYVTATTSSVLDNLDSSTEELLYLGGDYEIEFEDGVFYCRESSASHASGAYPGGYDPADHPVKGVTWYGAARHCDWLSMQSGRARAYEHMGDWACNYGDPYGAEGYRLPTDAEWEYAAQYNDDRLFPWGSFSANCNRANYWPNPDPVCVGWTSPVGRHPAAPAALALRDMAGNVEEWCNDWRVCDLGDSSRTDPVGPASGTHRVCRGGGWLSEQPELRCAFRDGSAPYSVTTRRGFRIARTLGAAHIDDMPDVERSHLLLRSSLPNPFRSSIQITYVIPDEAGTTEVNLSVYDVTGRLVDTLIDDSRIPGRYVVSWDGADSSGKPAAVGIYFVSLKADERTETKRIVLMR